MQIVLEHAEAGRYNPALKYGKAPVAQLDRVLGYEPRGRAFESLRACQQHQALKPPSRWLFCRLPAAGNRIERMKPTARRCCAPLRKRAVSIATLLSNPGAATRASSLLASVAPAPPLVKAAYPDREQPGGADLPSETEAVSQRRSVGLGCGGPA